MSWLERLMSGWSSPEDSRPRIVARGDPARVSEVEAVLEELRPMFRADAGDIDLVSVVDGIVEVRLAGACKTCHASDLTLFSALEPRLRARCAWVRELRAG